MENKKADDITVIKWQLQCLTWAVASGKLIAPSDLEWAIKMEDAFKKQGSLSPKQMQILENLYLRYT